MKVYEHGEGVGAPTYPPHDRRWLSAAPSAPYPSGRPQGDPLMAEGRGHVHPPISPPRTSASRRGTESAENEHYMSHTP